jgi:hypothetical protein
MEALSITTQNMLCIETTYNKKRMKSLTGMGYLCLSIKKTT